MTVVGLWKFAISYEAWFTDKAINPIKGKISHNGLITPANYTLNVLIDIDLRR